jgi:hypothetical protein
MTGSCASIRALFDGYLEERLAREERSCVREHLASCSVCRDEAAATDPALLFAVLPAPEISDAETAKVLVAVRAGIALKAAERRIAPAASGSGRTDGSGRPFRRAWMRPAMKAAAAVAAVALSWSLGPRAPSPIASTVREAPVAAVAAGAVPVAADVSDDLAATGGLGPLRPFAAANRSTVSPAAGSGPDGLEPAGSKGNLPADATIYDWNPGGGQPRVVWIVDRSLDI